MKRKRLGMVVSKRNTALAINRNKLKRLIRESFRKQVLPPLDVVVLTRSRATHQSGDKLTTTLNSSFSELAENYATMGL